jgi:hypothetical protein
VGAGFVDIELSRIVSVKFKSVTAQERHRRAVSDNGF